MDKFLLDDSMVETIEYFRGIDYFSLYGILDEIVSEDDTYDNTFFRHGQKVLGYFNEFDDREDDENFMKCMLGYYEVSDTNEGAHHAVYVDGRFLEYLSTSTSASKTHTATLIPAKEIKNERDLWITADWEHAQGVAQLAEGVVVTGGSKKALLENIKNF